MSETRIVGTFKVSSGRTLEEWTGGAGSGDHRSDAGFGEMRTACILRA